MPEYLAPGVYVEETSFRARSIEGVSTTTTGFIGAARFGPVTPPPDIITSLSEFEYAYGDGRPITFVGGSNQPNFLWHAARTFFEEGGKRLYLARIFRPLPIGDDGATLATSAPQPVYDPPEAKLADDKAPRGTTDPYKALYRDGHARATVPTTPADLATALMVRARFPGSGGNVRVQISFRYGQNVLVRQAGQVAVSSLIDRDIVLIDRADGTGGALHRAEWDSASRTWKFRPATGTAVALNTLDPDNATLASRDRVRMLTLAVSVAPIDGSRPPEVWDGLAPDPQHTRNGIPDSLSARFAPLPANAPQAGTLPIELLAGTGLTDGLALIGLLAPAPSGGGAGGGGAGGAGGGATPTAANTLALGLLSPDTANALMTYELRLLGGSDGATLGVTEYTGRAEITEPYKTGLRSFEDIEDISIVAAPGATYGYEVSDAARANAQAILNTVIAHCHLMRYRVAVLDCGEGQSIAQVRAMRGRFDSTHAALYYPWVIVRDPITRQDIALPPSGFVSGIYARNDIERAVWKAPANEVVREAIGFEMVLNKAQQDVLNPEGINCFRFFEGRGMRLWGARTMTSDPEWKYISVRRYFCYIERSIDKGTQWAVFEPNGERLWASVRRTIEDFLLNEWQSGALLGDRPEKAFFVKCDRSTMTQNDLDNGRLVCLIGVAPVKPAEFVIFRIGQWTADRRS